MTTTLIQTDKRGRATLTDGPRQYRRSDMGNGAILLEPARLLTEVEIAALSAPGLIDQINSSMETPTGGRPARRRSRES